MVDSPENADRLTDEEFYARIRELAHQATPPEVPSDGDDEPLELTTVVSPSPRIGPDEHNDAMLLTQPMNPASAAPAMAAPFRESDGPQDRSISGALAALEAREVAQQASTGPTVSNRPLDAIVQEMLRPMMQEWLDSNLDRIVREQVDAALTAEREKFEAEGGEQS